MKRALVTGGSGFLGSFVAEALAERGYRVAIFDRTASRYLGSGQEMVVGDILDAPALAAAATGADCVFHLAGLADLEAAHDRPRPAAEANILGTINALEAARKASARRFVFASTVYVYSRAGGFYRCSKQACESFIEEYERQHGLAYTVLRYGSLYGPRSDSSNGVFRLLTQALREGRIHHAGTPEDTREYIHVEDAARLSVDALADEYANRHLVITGAQTLRLRDLFTMFSEILGNEIDVEYTEPGRSHYRITPYTFSPRVGRKLTATHYVDMGQGILQLLETLRAAEHEAAGE